MKSLLIIVWEDLEDRKKMKHYQENSIDIISLYPKNLKNIDWDFTQKFFSLIRDKEGTNTFGKD